MLGQQFTRNATEESPRIQVPREEICRRIQDLAGNILKTKARVEEYVEYSENLKSYLEKQILHFHQH